MMNHSQTYPTQTTPTRSVTTGARGARSKLTAEQAAEIKRHLLDAQLTQAEIASMYGITPRNVSAIRTGKVWRHVEAGEVTQDTGETYNPDGTRERYSPKRQNRTTRLELIYDKIPRRGISKRDLAERLGLNRSNGLASILMALDEAGLYLCEDDQGLIYRYADLLEQERR